MSAVGRHPVPSHAAETRRPLPASRAPSRPERQGRVERVIRFVRDSSSTPATSTTSTTSMPGRRVVPRPAPPSAPRTEPAHRRRRFGPGARPSARTARPLPQRRRVEVQVGKTPYARISVQTSRSLTDRRTSPPSSRPSLRRDASHRRGTVLASACAHLRPASRSRPEVGGLHTAPPTELPESPAPRHRPDGLAPVLAPPTTRAAADRTLRRDAPSSAALSEMRHVDQQRQGAGATTGTCPTRRPPAALPRD